jgi:hypothetical protein
MAVVSRLYDTYAHAERAVRQLTAAGIPDSDISIVASNGDNAHRLDGDDKIDRDRDGVDDRAEGASAGAGIGAAVGGAAGLLAGLGMMAIPGIGPVVAAGWLASTALGAAVGGTAGGIVGALTQAGVSEEDAHVYAEGVRRGGTLLTVRVPDARRAEIDGILANSSFVDVRNRAAQFRQSGWNRFDERSPRLTEEELRRERQRYGQI